MSAKRCIFGDVIDSDGYMARSYFMADGRFNDEFPSGFETEVNLVTDGTANPSTIGYPRNGSEAHAGRTADDFKDARHGIDTLDSVDVRRKIDINQLRWSLA